MAIITSPSLSSPTLCLSPIFKPNYTAPSPSSSPPSIFSVVPTPSSKKTQSFRQSPLSAVPLRATQKWRICAFPLDILLSEADPLENSQLVESPAPPEDGVSSIISALLFVAFIGLSILTIGVIYIAVTDFLQKREREKFEKEEAAKKKSGKKGKVRPRARAGPRGFGQRIQDDDDDAE